MVPINELKPHPENEKIHPKDDKLIERLREIFRSPQGFNLPLKIDAKIKMISSGHARWEALKLEKATHAPCIPIDYKNEDFLLADLVADNSTNEWREVNKVHVRLLTPKIKSLDFNVKLFGFENYKEDEKQPVDTSEKGSLSKKFIFPPFSVLDGRKGEWLERKRAWNSLGIQGELGRPKDLLKFKAAEKALSSKNRTHGENYKGGDAWAASGTSIFDPALCELMYTWFTKRGYSVFDPFAGGSVRGVVASTLYRRYLGIELREEQVNANIQQEKDICKRGIAEWVCDDALNTLDHVKKDSVDFVFSCPPYMDLEVYSRDERDISNMDEESFMNVYSEIIKNSYTVLKEDRFACFVVGEVRDKKGNYKNFVGKTIEAFLKAGYSYYNEIILVTPIGSLCLRAGRIFKASRKIGKTHQNILVFVKGDGKKAAEDCGLIEVKEITEEDNEH